MNARALGLWSLAALILSLASANPVYRAVVLAAELNVLLALRRPDTRARPLLIGVTVAGLMAVLITFVVSHSGRHALFALPAQLPVVGGPFTAEALVFGVTSGLGIACAVLAVAPLSLVLQAHELVDALPAPLARTGAAVATALNLLPAIARSAGEIRDAQRLRGVRATGSGAMSGIAVPVVLTAVEDSVRLAEAMEARGYGSGARTHFTVTRWHARDVAVAATALAAAALFVALRLGGAAPDWYPFPSLSVPAVDPVAVIACMLLAVAALAP